MTSYNVLAPIAVFRFEQDGNILYKAWSPHRYGPAYTYDLIIEVEDNQHPMMNLEYLNFIQRIFDYLEIDHDTLNHFSTPYGKYLDMYVDFHSPVPISQRNDHIYFTTMRNQIFSPIFFTWENAVEFLNTQRRTHPLLTRDLQIIVIEHDFI
jgi:hypothetical protein